MRDLNVQIVYNKLLSERDVVMFLYPQNILLKNVYNPSDWVWPQHSYQLTVLVVRSHWPSGLWRGCVAARLLGLRVWTPLEAWMFLSCECCVLSGRVLCDGSITRPEEFYRQWRVIACDLETSRFEAALARFGLLRRRENCTSWHIQDRYSDMFRLLRISILGENRKCEMLKLGCCRW
jgi:hypothetical protein